MISRNIFKIFLAQIIRKLDVFLENGGFKNSTPPQTAIIGIKLNIYEKNSGKAFQTCLNCISSKKNKRDMKLSKHLTWNYLCNGS